MSSKLVMSGYLIDPNDGRIHTSFSELNRCTPGQVHSVLNERAGHDKPYTSPAMEFGQTRHDMWKEEAEKTGLSAEVFKKDTANIQIKAERVEQELASMIFTATLNGNKVEIVLHSRLDVYGDATVLDYKTTTMNYHRAVSTYNSSIQAKIYAYQAMINNLPVDKMVYAIEQWEREYTAIKGYFKVEKTMQPRYLVEARKWLERRCEVLITALEIEDKRIK